MKTMNNRHQIIKPWTLTLAVLLCISYAGSFSWAAVTLQLPKNICVLAVNGKNTRFYNNAELSDGINQIVIQYRGEFNQRGSRDRNIESSDTFVIKFMAENQTLEMISPWIKTIYQLESWNKSPDIRFVNPAGDALEFKISRLEKNGLQIFRDYAQELEGFNKTRAPAAVPPASFGVSSVNASAPAPLTAATPAAPSAAATAADPSEQSASKAGMAEGMLKYWYQQADEATRQKFKAWINAQ